MQLKGSILVFFGAISFGVLSTFVKLAYQAGFDVGEVTGSQMMLSVLLLWITFGIHRMGQQKKSERAIQSKPIAKKQVIRLLAAGTTVGSTGLLYYYSLQFIPASLAILLLFQFTWMGVLAEAVIQRTFPSKVKLLSLLLLLGGTVLATRLVNQSVHSFEWKGILFGFLAAISYFLFLFFSGKTEVSVPLFQRSAILGTGGFLLVIILYPPTFLTDGAWLSGLWKYALPLAVFGPYLSTLFIAKGAPMIDPGLTSILGAAELPSAMFMSSFVLHEAVGWIQWMGVFLILIGIALPELNQWIQRRSIRIE